MVQDMAASSTEQREEAEHSPDISEQASVNHGKTEKPQKPRRKRLWRLGIMEDMETDEVPGSVLLLSKAADHNIPLGLRNDPARRSDASLQSTYATSLRSEAMFGSHTSAPDKKRTKDGKIILEPQPEESMNDPLNWSTFRKDAALLSLGLYCMVGGGMTPILAAGFTNVSETYHVSTAKVALTTGLYMLGLGVGSVIASPTAILYGKRPVYLVASLCFVLTSVWCALSPNYPSLVVARVIQGLAVSPVECLPSATISEIYHLHEKAYRLGIYTLLLLGGKNLIPLVSAAIIQSLGWRWVFWVVAMVVGFCGVLLFFFVPETFWDRTPVPSSKRHRPSLRHLRSRSSHQTSRSPHQGLEKQGSTSPGADAELPNQQPGPLEHPTSRDNVQLSRGIIPPRRASRRARFADFSTDAEKAMTSPMMPSIDATIADVSPHHDIEVLPTNTNLLRQTLQPLPITDHDAAHNPEDYFGQTPDAPLDLHRHLSEDALSLTSITSPQHYTKYYRSAPPKSFLQQLAPYNGRLTKTSWFRVAARPWVLFAYPAILWSSAVYALSVGWLIILSESMSTVFRSRATYNFDAIQTGLVYISPFIGGILGTVIAGKASDIVVRFMARRNDGIYEPEFRLVMAIPVAICTTIGLMGFGWSAQERDAWIVPTIFFGIISFGCTLGSTTAITFAVDSYRQYAGEALVTLNWSKNVFDGLVFSLFFNDWLQADGSKLVFLCLGGVQLFFLLWTIPLYIYGKRLRMWTVRKNLMAKL